MSKTTAFIIQRMAELGLSYDFDNELEIREQLMAELELMTVEHCEFMDLSGSLHNSQFTEADWEVV